MNAEQVLKTDVTFSDEPIDTDEIPGLNDAIERVAETKEKELVRCDDRLSDYDVYWNDKTDTVRFAAVIPGASYEAPQDAIGDA